MMVSTRLRICARHLSSATDAAAEAARASTFPYVPLLAVALSAPIVGVKSGVLSVDQLPDGVKAVLDDADKATGGRLSKFVFSTGPPPPRIEPPPVAPADTCPAAPTPAAPPDVKRYLDEHKHAILGLLYRELAAVRAKESWLGLVFQPLTLWRLRSERLAILSQLELRDAHE